MKTLKKTLCLVLAVVLAVGVLVIPANADRATWNGFTDKDKANVKYEEALGALTGMGIINGRGDKLEPNAYVTRTEAVIMIVRAIMGGSTWTVPQTATKFNDVPATHYASGYVAYAVSQGIVAGKSDTEFKPDDLVTGYELAKMSLVAANLKTEFDPSVWQIESASTAFRKGLLVGLENINDLNKALTREEAAQLIWNAVKYDEVVNNVHTGIGKVNFNLTRSESNEYDDFGRPSVRWYNSATKETYYQGTRQGVADFYVDGEYLTVKMLREELGLANGSGLSAKVTANGNNSTTVNLDKDDTKLWETRARGAHVFVYNADEDATTYEVYVNYTYAAYFQDDFEAGNQVTTSNTGYCKVTLNIDAAKKDIAIFDINSDSAKAFNAKVDGATILGVSITRKSNNNNDRYIYLDGVKTYLSARAIIVNSSTTVIQAELANITVSKTQKYNAYVDNAGNIIALVAVAAAAQDPSVKYDNFGYVLSYSGKAGSNADNKTDMQFGISTTEVAAQAKVLMVNLKTGDVGVYLVETAKNADAANAWYTVGVDGKTTTGIAVTDVEESNSGIHGFVAYKKLESGKYGITSTDVLDTIDSTDQGYTVASSFTTNKNGLVTVDGSTYFYADSNTKVKVLTNHSTDATNKHVSGYEPYDFQGYKSLDDKVANTDATCTETGYTETLGVGALFVTNDENVVVMAYVFGEEDETVDTTVTYNYYMYVSSGDTTVDGTILNFVNGGAATTLYDTQVKGAALVAAHVYIGVKDAADGKIELTDVTDNATYSETFEVDGFVNENGEGYIATGNTIHVLADGWYTINNATKSVVTTSPFGKNVTVYYANNKTDAANRPIVLIVIK